MALVLADRVRDTTTTTGTGTVTLSGTAPTGYQNFSVIGNANTTYYTINAGSQWEVGIGTYSSTGPTLARTTVLESSNANALVNFSAGTKDVFVTYPSDRAVTTDGVETLTNKTINGSNNTITNVSLTTAVTGTLPVANGGTGVTTSTGTGSVVLSNSPVLVTPTLGAASATSIANGLGAVGTPSYTFTGDLNTGMWSPSTDTVAFSTNGAEGMRIDSSGNVGIGTTSLSARFTVNGGSGTSQTRFEVSTTEVQEVATNAAQSAYANRLADAAQHIWKITNSERMRIDSSGNVGIGTSSPASKLSVSGSFDCSGVGKIGTTVAQAAPSTTDIVSTSNSILGGQGGNAIFVGQYPTTFASWIQSSFQNPTTATYNLVLQPLGGNVGVGTSSPAYLLHLNQNGNTQAWISATNAGSNSAGVGFENQGQRNWQIWADRTNDALQFGNNSRVTTNMVITSAGNVGIGTTSPGSKLDVRSANIADGTNGGIINVYSTTAQAANIGGKIDLGGLYDGSNSLSFASVAGRKENSTSGDWSGYMQFSTRRFGGDFAERMRIGSNGNVTLANKIVPNVQSVASAATITPNADTDTQVSVTALAVPATLAAPSGTPSDGQSLVIRIEDDGTARALTWTTGSSGAYRAVGITLPTTTVATKVLYVGCKYNSTDLRWDAVALSQEA